MPTYFDLLPQELNEIIWKQVHHLMMADIKIDVEMHYMYRRNLLCSSVFIAATLCKNTRRHHERVGEYYARRHKKLMARRLGD